MAVMPAGISRIGNRLGEFMHGEVRDLRERERVGSDGILHAFAPRPNSPVVYGTPITCSGLPFEQALQAWNPQAEPGASGALGVVGTRSKRRSCRDCYRSLIISSQ